MEKEILLTDVPKNTTFRDMSNQDYHGVKGVFSSSQLKDILDDPEYFHAKYILKTVEKLSIPAFDIGTYFHTAILEPEKLASETAIYSGIRRGKEWDKFQEDNKGKAIITESEFKQADNLVKAVKNSEVAMGLVGSGHSEVSAFVELRVEYGEIYSPIGFRLAHEGWEPSNYAKKVSVEPIYIKVRADLLADDFILDLKSTTGNAKSQYSVRKKISEYSYDLSAALYLDMFTIATGRIYSDFYWVFASKDYANAKTYLASKQNISVGRAKWKKAIITLSECITKNWVFTDSVAILEPMPYELEHLKQKDEDLI